MHIIWKRIYFCVGRKLCNYHSITASKYRVCLTPLNIANQYCLLDLVEKTRLFLQKQQNWVLFWYTRINFTVRHCFYHIEKNGYDYYSEWNFQTYFHFKQLEWKKNQLFKYFLWQPEATPIQTEHVKLFYKHKSFFPQCSSFCQI